MVLLLSGLWTSFPAGEQRRTSRPAAEIFPRSSASRSCFSGLQRSQRIGRSPGGSKRKWKSNEPSGWCWKPKPAAAKLSGSSCNQFETTVFATVMSRLRNRAEAREVTQDVFVQAMRKLAQLREPERFGGWLRQIAVRMSINRAVRRPPERRSARNVHFAEDRAANPARRLAPHGAVDAGLGRTVERSATSTAGR